MSYLSVDRARLESVETVLYSMCTVYVCNYNGARPMSESSAALTVAGTDTDAVLSLHRGREVIGLFELLSFQWCCRFVVLRTRPNAGQSVFLLWIIGRMLLLLKIVITWPYTCHTDGPVLSSFHFLLVFLYLPLEQRSTTKDIVLCI